MKTNRSVVLIERIREKGRTKTLGKIVTVRLLKIHLGDKTGCTTQQSIVPYPL